MLNLLALIVTYVHIQQLYEATFSFIKSHVSGQIQLYFSLYQVGSVEIIH